MKLKTMIRILEGFNQDDFVFFDFEGEAMSERKKLTKEELKEAIELAEGRLRCKPKNEFDENQILVARAVLHLLEVNEDLQDTILKLERKGELTEEFRICLKRHEANQRDDNRAKRWQDEDQTEQLANETDARDCGDK